MDFKMAIQISPIGTPKNKRKIQLPEHSKFKPNKIRTPIYKTPHLYNPPQHQFPY